MQRDNERVFLPFLIIGGIGQQTFNGQAVGRFPGDGICGGKTVLVGPVSVEVGERLGLFRAGREPEQFGNIGGAAGDIRNAAVQRDMVVVNVALGIPPAPNNGGAREEGGGKPRPYGFSAIKAENGGGGSQRNKGINAPLRVRPDPVPAG